MATRYIVDNATGQTINGEQIVRPYKVYSATITQTGTTAPIATVLENTIGEIVWSYDAPGQYIATLQDAFTENKVFFIHQSIVSDDGGATQYTVFLFRSDPSFLSLRTYNMAYTLTDGCLQAGTPLSLEIRVYN